MCTDTKSTPTESSPPPLSIEILADPRERKDALKLIVDSVAQQRQTASRAIIFHPVSLSILVPFLAFASYGSYVGNDYSSLLISCPGIIFAYLATIRYFTSAYIRTAEDTDWLNWLKNTDGAEDAILGARFGREIIAAVVLRLDKRDGRALVRGWTTRSKYRQRGLGGDMLGESVKIAKRTLGKDCTVEFATDHANSTMPLYSIFNGPFLVRQLSAEKALAAAVKGWEEGKDDAQ
ncbi:hypothetical protein F66182_10343 [Fusarium sp. NRRL 66182]|nr:hypothetical protein F66182_10343 [Fusarium sp. NRRL 66182]